MNEGGLPFVSVVRPLGQIQLRSFKTCPTSAGYKHNTTTTFKAPRRNGSARQSVCAPCHSTAVVYSVHLQPASVAAQLPRNKNTYPVDLVSVDSKAWVRDPGWAGPVAECAMNNEHSQERHPKRSTNPAETPALNRDLLWLL